MKFLGTENRSENIFDLNGTTYRRVVTSKTSVEGKVTISNIDWRNATGKKSVSKSKGKELTKAYKALGSPTTTGTRRILRNPTVPRYKSQFKIVDKELMSIINRGSLLAAVKHLKDKSNLGLKEAKDYCDTLRLRFQNK